MPRFEPNLHAKKVTLEPLRDVILNLLYGSGNFRGSEVTFE